jgi:hypothetical protein
MVTRHNSIFTSRSSSIQTALHSILQCAIGVSGREQRAPNRSVTEPLRAYFGLLVASEIHAPGEVNPHKSAYVMVERSHPY